MARLNTPDVGDAGYACRIDGPVVDELTGPGESAAARKVQIAPTSLWNVALPELTMSPVIIP